MVVYYANELYHHGIEGQKWGQRRYQNPDGTLTEEGKKRYNKLVKRETIYYNKGEYGRAEKRANKRFDKMQKKLDYENENGGALAKTKYKYNLAKLEKEAYDKIGKYANKTIKEIDPDSYKSNIGKSVATSLAITMGSMAIAPFTGVAVAARVNYRTSTEKAINEYGSAEQAALRQKEKKEKEKYKNAKKLGIDY